MEPSQPRGTPPAELRSSVKRIAAEFEAFLSDDGLQRRPRLSSRCNIARTGAQGVGSISPTLAHVAAIAMRRIRFRTILM
jgi:hypothetical protein